jgi:hypothetical protein
MNFGEVDWAGLFILILGIGILIAGCFMFSRAAGVIVIGLLLILGALISSRSRVG